MMSFNSPQGMCLHCDGLGTCFDFDPELLIPDGRKSFLAPCVAALRAKPGKWRRHIYEGVARHVGFDLNEPWQDLPEQARRALLHGTGDAHITFEWKSRNTVWKHGGKFEGVLADLQAAHKRSSSSMVRRFYEQFMRQSLCPGCKGARLTPAALAITLTGHLSPPAPGGEASPSDGAAARNARMSPTPLNIDQVCKLSISRTLEFFEGLELDATRRIIAEEPLKEIRARLRFLLDVGLDYLTLERTAPTLSGGESQRIRLASQIGCGLVGVLYVLDEPSIGLHPRDNQRLLASLKRLRDMGNTVIVVEHDRDTMLAADRIVDFGPGPGVRGGRIVSQGTPAEVAADPQSITGGYLSGREEIAIPAKRRPVTRPPTKGAKPRGRACAPRGLRSPVA
jgi:excinuclease ABC subunit A